MLQTILVFSPALGALIVGLFGRMIGDRAAQLVTCGLMGVTALCAWINLFANVGERGLQGRADALGRGRQLRGRLGAARRLAVDRDDVLVVGFISFLIHVYSVGYMSHDPSIPRFMAYLSLFTFFMLMLVTSDNLLQLFFGWEGVGVASYLLIGFWYDASRRPAPPRSRRSSSTGSAISASCSASPRPSSSSTASSST